MARNARTLIAVAIAAAASAGSGCTRVPRPVPEEDAERAHLDAAQAPLASPLHAIARPPEANAELGILTDIPRANAIKALSPAALGALVGPAHCGDDATCVAVRTFLTDPARLTVSIVPAADWGLPPRSTLDVLAKGLTPSERDDVFKRPAVVVVTAHGTADNNHLPLRAAFAITAAIAQEVRGIVYDEVLHRIETAAQFSTHAVTARLGEQVFRPDRIVIQLYRQDDGTARLLTLGMRRFGAADVAIEGAPMGAARPLGNVVNAVAGRLAEGVRQAPVEVTLAQGRSARVDLETPPPHEGDPDNAFQRIVAPPGAPPGSPDFIHQLVGSETEELVDNPDDPRLAIASQRAAHSFPAALGRWRKSAGRGVMLLVRLPFPISSSDAGTEWMWVEVTSADDPQVAGLLANSPAYATELKSGAKVKGKRSEIADWLLKWPDGGTEGGETIRILEGHR